MASKGRDSLEHRLFQQAYISPLAAVRDFFEALTELRGAVEGADNGRLLSVCENVSVMGEKVVFCLEHQMRQHNRATETAQEISGAFRIGLQRVMQLREEANSLKKMVRDLKLAEQGLDTRDVPMAPQPSSHSQTHQGFTTFEAQSEPIPRAASLENFRKHMDATLSSKKSTKSTESNFGGSLRKAKSDSDIAVKSLKKKVEGLTLDNTRLKASEKKLLKDNIKLNRSNKTLEQERDRAEDRLKIEQTQRDSIEKLRQRNKELEDQLRKLCESQVIRERGGNVFSSSGGLDPHGTEVQSESPEAPKEETNAEEAPKEETNTAEAGKEEVEVEGERGT